MTSSSSQETHSFGTIDCTGIAINEFNNIFLSYSVDLDLKLLTAINPPPTTNQILKTWLITEKGKVVWCSPSRINDAGTIDKRCQPITNMLRAKQPTALKKANWPLIKYRRRVIKRVNSSTSKSQLPKKIQPVFIRICSHSLLKQISANVIAHQKLL